MNTFETLSFPEEIPGIERQTLIDMRDGFARVRKLSEQAVGGADVASEKEQAREDVINRVAKALADIEQEVADKSKYGEQGDLNI